MRLFNRHKILLSYIGLMGKVKSKTILTKSLFLLCKEKLADQKIYDFIPYFYGPYSFTMSSLDIPNMMKENILITEKNNNELSYKIKDKNFVKKIFLTLDEKTQNALIDTFKKYGEMKVREIKNYTYKNFPYFASRNVIEKSLYKLNKEKKSKIFTIGYEGKSLEKFLNQLIINNVRILIDVRNNTNSMKYGFSSNTIKKYLKKIDIEYLSIPELGINKEHRKNLDNQLSYNKLFQYYFKNIIPKNLDKIELLKHNIFSKKRIALMCFEKDNRMCHRNILSKYLDNYCHNQYKVKHL